MKKIVILLILSVVVSNLLIAQNKTLEKALRKEYKQKLNEFKKQGWQIDASSRTFEVALLQHYENLKDGQCQELIGEVSNCRSTNVCRQAAYNNALTTYASLASSYIKGRATSDVNLNASEEKETNEFDKFYAAYERLINAEIKAGVLTESFSIKKKNGKTNEYRIFFIVDEEKASLARRRAMERAAEETQLAQKYAKEISNFVNEGFKLNQ